MPRSPYRLIKGRYQRRAGRTVGVGVLVSIVVGVGVMVSIVVGVGVAVVVGVAVGASVAVTVAVAVGVGVPVAVAVGVGVDQPGGGRKVICRCAANAGLPSQAFTSR